MTTKPGGTGSKECSLRVGVLVNVPALLSKHGVDPRPIFKRTGTDMQQIKDPDQKLSYLKLSHLLAECAEATRCGHFGLPVGQTATQ